MSLAAPSKKFIGIEELHLLSLLPTAPSSYDSYSINATARCFKGTREQLIASIMEWLAQKQGEGLPVFWLNGIAGIGKSTVARTIAEFAKSQEMLGASFFFSRTEGRSDPAVFFTTLAYQLAFYSPLFKTAITNSLRSNPMIGRAALPLQIRQLIVDPLGSIEGVPFPVVIVVDAVDECGENGVKEILVQLLAHIPSLPSFKILVTGRPEYRITSILNSERNITKIFMHDIEKSIVDSDIILYLESCFREITVLFPDCEWFWTAEELAFLASLAGSLFIYAVTAVYLIKDPYIHNPRKQLERLLKGKSAVGSSSFPFDDLDRLYDQVIDGAVPPEKEREIAARFRAVVGAIIGLETPLNLRSIERLMNVDSGDARAALVLLPSVIALPETSDAPQPPRVYHPSFPDYITDPSRCRRPQLVIDPHINHLQIFKRCFTIISTMLKRDICAIADSCLMNSDIEGLEAKVRQAIPPWFRYAILHWPTHLSAVPSDNSEAISCLEHLCTKNLLHWVEACALLDSLELVTPLVRQARGWAVCRGSSI